MNNNYRRSRYVSQPGGNWDPWLTIFVISLTTTVLGIIMILVLANSSLELINSMIRGMGVLVLGIGILGLVITTPHYINQYSHQRSKLSSLSCLKSKKFNNFLIENKLYVKNASDSMKIDLPVCEVTQDGFRLSAIGNLRSTLLSDETIDNLNSFLALNHTNRRVIESYYQQGWVNYVVRHDIQVDRLNF